jgi:hypothetical protein
MIARRGFVTLLGGAVAWPLAARQTHAAQAALAWLAQLGSRERLADDW